MARLRVKLQADNAHLATMSSPPRSHRDAGCSEGADVHRAGEPTDSVGMQMQQTTPLFCNTKIAVSRARSFLILPIVRLRLGSAIALPVVYPPKVVRRATLASPQQVTQTGAF